MFRAAQSQFAPSTPQGPIKDITGATYVPSSFGMANTTFKTNIETHSLFNGQRPKFIQYMESFYKCSHHDGKLFDFQGRVRQPGQLYSQPLLGSQLPTQYVPLDMRRPNDPYRLAKLVVNAFSALVFGEGKWPSIKVIGDSQTEDFANALVQAQYLPTAMSRARKVGGSCGSVGLSWRFCDGKPRVAVHRPQYIHVLEWTDFEELIPSHVVKLNQVDRNVITTAGKRAVMRFWQRRDWTPEADLFYAEEPVDDKSEPAWRIEREDKHGDDFPHFVWIRNLEDTDETTIDGLCDYDGLTENLIILDTLASVVTRGGVLNLDPTLKLKMDPEIVNRYGVRKGSDNAIITGLGGDASYMELDGTSLSAGSDLIGSRRAHALEVTQCVVPNPETIAAAGTSSLGIKLVYGPMLARCNELRDSYGKGITQLLCQQIESARNLLTITAAVPVDIDAPPESFTSPLIDERRSEDDVEQGALTLTLAPRIIETDELDDHGEPTGRTSVAYEERSPGEGGDLQLVWPQYFNSTPLDDQQSIATLSMAAGGKPVLSRRTAVEKAAAIAGVDPREEWRRVIEQDTTDKAASDLMFPETGGTVTQAGLEPSTPLSDESQPIGEETSHEGTSTGQGDAPLAEQPGGVQDVKMSTDFVLNGAQISAAVDIVSKVVSGDIPRDAGLGMLELLFNIPSQAASKIMGSAGLRSPLTIAPDETSPNNMGESSR